LKFAKKTILSLSFILCLGLLVWVFVETRPTEGNAEKPLLLHDKMDDRSLGINLQKQGFIRNSWMFSIYGAVTGKQEAIVSGEHTLKQGMSYKEIFSDLSTLDKETQAIEFIFPEGYDVEQIASSLSKEGIIKRQAFLQEAETWDVMREDQRKKLGVKKNQLKKGTKYAMEGLLFPDTYFFDKNMNPAEVIQQMTDRFIEATADVKIKSNLKPYEWIILASIIEKEALLNEEKPIIAGVFMNRIQKEQKLQSCSTVQYLLKKPKPRLLRKDLKVKSPYNTYLNKGLPPSPISSPGLPSLKAAADPQNHNYYYFVAKGDGTWSHYFSETYEEHKKHTRLSGNY
jgi:UPF0755 protein